MDSLDVQRLLLKDHIRKEFGNRNKEMVGDSGKSDNTLYFTFPYSLNVFFFKSPLKDIFSPLFLEREEGRERDIDVRKTHQVIASHVCPDWGLSAPRPSIKLST